MTAAIVLGAILFGAFLAGVVMIGGVWWRQERIAYQPPRQTPAVPANIQRIDYYAADGQRLFGYIVEPEGTPHGVLIAFHGNADLAVWQIPWAREVARRSGWCVFLPEYRGYGSLDGEPSYRGVQADARAAWAAAVSLAADLDADGCEFALFGHSLGSGVACELAAELLAGAQTSTRSPGDAPAALVLQSPFTSARDMARVVSTRPVQWLWRLISRVHYDTRHQFDVLDVPVWIAHGARDWLVPVTMGHELFGRARHPGELLIVDDANHNDVAEAAGERYWTWITRALIRTHRGTQRSTIDTPY